MLIIGISGKMGSGKDYVIENFIIPLIRGVPYAYTEFADQIKVSVASENNIDLQLLYDNKSAEHRRLLQKRGTEEGRDIYGKNIWINYLHNWLKVREKREKNQIALIADCRFLNEVEWIESQGGVVIRIDAEDRVAKRVATESQGNPETEAMIRNHSSETRPSPRPSPRSKIIFTQQCKKNLCT